MLELHIPNKSGQQHARKFEEWELKPLQGQWLSETEGQNILINLNEWGKVDSIGGLSASLVQLKNEPYGQSC